MSRSLQRALTAMTRTAIRAGSKAITQALKAKPARKTAAAKRSTAKRVSAKPASPKPSAAAAGDWSAGLAIGIVGAMRYWLFKPPGLQRGERLPLVVMLHGCWQGAEDLAASSKMNRTAARERFFVLYPEQDRISNVHGCWHWYDTRSGRAQAEAGAIDAVIDQVCLLQAVDPERIALAGLSAGAGMAALLAVRRPQRFRAIAMHSGIGAGVAHSSATALRAMRGHRVAGAALAPIAAGSSPPALLVIHGSADPIVAPGNGAEAAHQWAARAGAKPGTPRTVQRGMRYAATITDYRARGRLVATLCEVSGLGHAWSGGAAGQAYSDPKGPDASRMIWAFMARQFARGADVGH
ncbi:alpha/beta hydrolase family esterase [Parazoarcus communis]|uniref:extracellular catalytic domain type 1 short-chain-length polyhydroxyalkanoate depolymerase n=1 Tax=Parazoarcus communis TaxID=41977 RepID=UPI001F2B1053|nr:PHB depolymerase family esterase [Parazoarcus communis]